MQLQPFHKIPILITIVAFLLALITLGYAASITNNTKQKETAISDNVLQDKEGAEDSTLIHLTDDVSFLEAFPSIGNRILMQVYRQHYNLTNNLDKIAEIEGDITKNGTKKSFTMRFIPSGSRVDVTVETKNSAMNDFLVTVTKAGE